MLEIVTLIETLEGVSQALTLSEEANTMFYRR
jgi:hypothetical protein